MLMSTSNQPEVFAAMLYIGFLTGMGYDLIRAVKSISRSSFTSAASDLIFWAAFTLLFLNELNHRNHGEFKLYCLFGVSIGWAIYYFTICRLIYSFFYTLAEAAKEILVRMAAPIKKIIKRMRLIRACPEVSQGFLKRVFSFSRRNKTTNQADKSEKRVIK